MTWSEPEVCPRCGAVMRPGAQWCGLCHASFAAEPIPEGQPLADPAGPVDPLTAPPEAPSVRRGKHAATSTVPPVEQDIVSQTPGIESVDVMLSMLAAEHRQERAKSALLGHVMPLVEDKASRTYLTVGGVVTMTALFFIVIALFGLLT